MMETLVEIKDLHVHFKTERGIVRALNGVNITVKKGETVGLVGESGSGKTVTATSILGLLPKPVSLIPQGNITFDGHDLLSLSRSEFRALRGKEISMIFQEPMTALNPVMKIGEQLSDVLRHHKGLSRAEAKTEAIALLKRVRIPIPERRIHNYPHQLSGGMRQRVMIAMALSCEPKLLLADEPTTALDVTTQAQVLQEMTELQQEFHMSMVLVTHDLGIVAETCQRVYVMYAGEIVEEAPTEELFAKPKHPYTKGLLESIPRIRNDRVKSLPTIPGRVPDLVNLPKGCLFAERCPKADQNCRDSRPPLKSYGPSQAACIYPENT